MRSLIVALSLLTSGCGWQLWRPSSEEPSGTPLARAVNGGQASFTLTTCAPTTERARMIEEIVLQLNAQGVVASASGPGTQSRVVLNLCGAGGPPAQANRARTP